MLVQNIAALAFAVVAVALPAMEERDSGNGKCQVTVNQFGDIPAGKTPRKIDTVIFAIDGSQIGQLGHAELNKTRTDLDSQLKHQVAICLLDNDDKKFSYNQHHWKASDTEACVVKTQTVHPTKKGPTFQLKRTLCSFKC